MQAYLKFSGAIFGVVALAHLHRLVRHWPIDVAGHTVPLWVSWVALVLAGGLSIWALRLLRGSTRTV